MTSPCRQPHDSVVANLTESPSQYADEVDDQRTIDAICMRLSAGIESLSRLEQRQRDAIFGDAWAQMWGMRNRIAHGYLLINVEIVRRTVEHDIPVIVTRIQERLRRVS